jgi:hypothetical protein
MDDFDTIDTSLMDELQDSSEEIFDLIPEFEENDSFDFNSYFNSSYDF